MNMERQRPEYLQYRWSLQLIPPAFHQRSTSVPASFHQHSTSSIPPARSAASTTPSVTRRSRSTYSCPRTCLRYTRSWRLPHFGRSSGRTPIHASLCLSISLSAPLPLPSPSVPRFVLIHVLTPCTRLRLAFSQVVGVGLIARVGKLVRKDCRVIFATFCYSFRLPIFVCLFFLPFPGGPHM